MNRKEVSSLGPLCIPPVPFSEITRKKVQERKETPDQEFEEFNIGESFSFLGYQMEKGCRVSLPPFLCINVVIPQ